MIPILYTYVRAIEAVGTDVDDCKVLLDVITMSGNDVIINVSISVIKISMKFDEVKPLYEASIEVNKSEGDGDKNETVLVMKPFKPNKIRYN